MYCDATDDYNLQRFVRAQQPIYETALSELQAGLKQTHWIWFIFPQVEGLGHSAMSQRFAIKSKAEAFAYLAHPLLAARLAECTQAVLVVAGKSALDIFGSPDHLKFKSSMTLFDTVDAGHLYRKSLDRFFDGEHDSATLAVLDRWRG